MYIYVGYMFNTLIRILLNYKMMIVKLYSFHITDLENQCKCHHTIFIFV